MDIYDIIIEPPRSTVVINLDSNFISLFIIAVALLISVIMALYYRRFIAIACLHYITTLLKNEKITYKHFAFLLARILCYRHKYTQISKERPPINGSKKKQYLWFDLVETLNEARYGKTNFTEKTQTNLPKTALEWLRYS